MAENSKIEWTTHTFNPWIGCTKVSAGCTHCYAEDYAKRYGRAIWGPHGTRVKTSAAYWQQPLKWNREAEGVAERPRVFCASLADAFEEWDGPITGFVSKLPVYLSREWRLSTSPLNRATMDDLRRELFALIDATPNLDWLLLTKRPENIRWMWASAHDGLSNAKTIGDVVLASGPRSNVWLLTSIATQADADKNIPELLKCRDLSPVLGVSAEPLVEKVSLEKITLRKDGEIPSDLSVELGDYILPLTGSFVDSPTLDWVICGGESGHGARRFDIAWAESIIAQCKAAGVACFIKQLGANPYAEIECELSEVRDKKGGAMEEWPEGLRVREFPSAVVSRN